MERPRPDTRFEVASASKTIEPSSRHETPCSQSTIPGGLDLQGNARGASPSGAARARRDLPRIQLQGIERLLCIGARCKDIERGAGGTIAHVIATCPGVEVWWVVLGGETPHHARKARRAAKLFLRGAGSTKVLIHGFREGFMPFQGEQVRETFEELSTQFRPDLILSHRDDDHLDHRLISQLTRDTWESRTILEYELLTGHTNLQRASIYVPLDEEACRTKIERLQKVYGAYGDNCVCADEALWALMRLRGAESGTARFAEAFDSRRIICS